MIFNVRGGCLYPNQELEAPDMKTFFPGSKQLNIKKLLLTGVDGEQFMMPKPTVRRLRLIEDEHGHGIVLRFLNLSEEQLDTIEAIIDRYEKT